MTEVHPAFAASGKKAGLEIWRIENFEPIVVPASNYGKFFSGDSYIVLSTSGDENHLSWDIHFWLGSKTSTDEAGAAAMLTVNMDDQQFQGRAVQHREVQGYESRQFLNYFEPAIRYLDGGHASGFHHVTINEGSEKRLFQIKGRRNVRVKQVDASAESLNNGDCFILDIDHNIYVYVGDKAKGVERLKAITVANQIRDQDHNGRAEIEIVDPDSKESDYEKFFEALGSGDKDSVAEATEGGDDEEFERGATTEVSLSEISDSSGSLKIVKLSAPFTQDLLNTKECYILDTGSYSGIYVWVGRESNDKEKTEAMKKAEHYLKTHDYPDWVDASAESLNNGDCFILDIDHNIYVYVGDKAKGVERLKAITVANQIRDQDHNGRAEIEIVDPDSKESDYEKFFEALGSGDKDSVAEATEGGDDEEFERGATTEVSLSEISDSSGSLKIVKLSAPFTQDLLNTKECYILDTGSYSGIYVWVGRESNDKEKTEAMKKAEHYLKTHDYPDWVHVTRVPEGVEPTAFKQHFQDWN